MLEQRKIGNLNDFFTELKARREKGVYFYRINGYNEEIASFIKEYYKTARTNGVVIEGKIPNPTEKNLSYYDEIMGTNFRMDRQFIALSLKIWLPRMNAFQNESVSSSIYASLESMRECGKTEAMIKNAYIKFMCWLYYKFERVVSQLGENSIPKILYEGEISRYELILISILSGAGCDVILLQYKGDNSYLKLDPKSLLSEELSIQGMRAFPEGYSIKMLRQEMQEDMDKARLYGKSPSVTNSTNTWIKGKAFDDIRKNEAERGMEKNFFYNCYFRVRGVEDRNTYAGELYQLQQDLKRQNRRIVIVNQEIPKPTPDEIAGIRRKGPYGKKDQMIMDLVNNLVYPSNAELQQIMRRVFTDIMLSESKRDDMTLNRLTNRAVYLLCWVKRYLPKLFSNWKIPDISCFIYMGGCKNENESMLMGFFARLPVDVLILCPDLSSNCCLNDMLLYEIVYQESVAIDQYPEDNAQAKIGTVAYHAEKDLDTLLYRDSGIYRNQQYTKANVICLQTMYEEIQILWNQELKYRPGFHTNEGVVNIPVIFSKISGVKDGSVVSYWSSVRGLITEDTIVVRNAPYIEPTDPNPMKACSSGFYQNGKLKINKIKNHPQYPYGILRETMQDFMLDRLESLIEQKLIKGTGENGTEYTIIAQILNLPKAIVREIQKFDFTKRNPKLIYINTSEKVISLEDSIICAYLNLIGFDVLFFVPTGYQSVEKYFNKRIIEEHQIGEYRYDMQVPDLSAPIVSNTRHSWREIIFKRG